MGVASSGLWATHKRKVTGESQGLVHGWLCQVHGVRYELNADVGEVLVGLCPARHGNVRLEWDPVCPSLLHNYGHGGSGVTFSWGCAIEASAMVDRVFKRPQIYLSKL